MYPAVAAQDIYTGSATQKVELGTEMVFRDSAGDLSFARYMQNGQGASIAAGAAGYVVGYADRWGRFDSAPIANTGGQPAQIAGVLALTESLADGGYCWVVYKGKCTNFQLAATYASSAAERWLSVDANARFATAVSTYAAAATTDLTGDFPIFNRLIALLRSTSATVSSGTASTGVVDLLWK